MNEVFVLLPTFDPDEIRPELLGVFNDKLGKISLPISENVVKSGLIEVWRRPCAESVAGESANPLGDTTLVQTAKPCESQPERRIQISSHVAVTHAAKNPKPITKFPKNYRRWNERHKRAMRLLLIARDGSCCHWCGLQLALNVNPNTDRFATIDHVIRQAEAGPSVIDNLVLSCGPCNHERHR